MIGPSPDQPSNREVELEWQFDALDLRPVERWLAALPSRTSPGKPAMTAVAKPLRRLVDRYLDTEDWRLGRGGFVLRTRHHGRASEVTLKDTRSPGASGLRRRLQATEPVPAGGVDSLDGSGPVGRRLQAVVGPRALRQVMEIRTRRRAFSLHLGGVDDAQGAEAGQLALDETLIVIGSGEPPVHLRRVELETDADRACLLEPLAEELRASCGLQAATLSKYEAGLLALGLSIPDAVDLGPTGVSADSDLGEVGQAVIRRHVGVLLAKEAGTRLGEDVEELHDMRVATRRLRAAIDFFGDALPVRARSLRAELTWLAGLLGAVRDLDVQLSGLQEVEPLAAVAGIADAGSGLDHLRALLEGARAQARRQLLQALDSPRWEQLAEGLIGLARHEPASGPAAGRRSALVALPEMVARRHRAAGKAARRAVRTGEAAEYHRLRIRGKRLRYSLEFTAELYGRRADRYVRRLAQLQDRLGQMQDAEVATARLLTLATASDETLPATTVFAMGSLAERHRGEAAALLAHMDEHLQVLGGKEWRELQALMDRRRERAGGKLGGTGRRRTGDGGCTPVARAPGRGRCRAAGQHVRPHDCSGRRPAAGRAVGAIIPRTVRVPGTDAPAAIGRGLARDRGAA